MSTDPDVPADPSRINENLGKNSGTASNDDATYPAAVTLPGGEPISASLTGSTGAQVPPSPDERGILPEWSIAIIVIDLVFIRMHVSGPVFPETGTLWFVGLLALIDAVLVATLCFCNLRTALNLRWWAVAIIAIDLGFILMHISAPILPRMRTIVFVELLALANTMLAAALYFWDLRKAVNAALIDGQRGLAMDVMFPWFLNLLILSLAGTALYLFAASNRKAVFLGWSIENFYLVLLVASFLMFTGLDYIFSRHSTSRRKTREYWELLFLVDAPASIAFVILSALYIFGEQYQPHWLSFDIVSGATIMQMMLANLLFLLVQSNVHHVVLTKFQRNTTGT